MGNQELKVPDQMSSINLEQLCSLLEHDYDSPHCLSFDPFLSSQEIMPEETVSPILKEIDAQISLMVDELGTTQNPLDCQQQQLAPQKSTPVPTRLTLSKNQSQKTKIIKKQSQSNQHKKPKRVLRTESQVEPQLQQTEEENDVQEMRDQNNCKSYHKLVKNYLVSMKLGHLLEPYQKYYANKSYFVIALMIIEHHLGGDFTQAYQRIAEKEVQVQQAKITKKAAQLAKIKREMRQGSLDLAESSALSLQRDKLVRQIAHIKVLQHYIADFSTRSCAAYFQGKTEESLRILYLKDDVRIKKNYYFLQALTVLRRIEAQVRKLKSHARY